MWFFYQAATFQLNVILASKISWFEFSLKAPQMVSHKNFLDPSQRKKESKQMLEMF